MELEKEPRFLSPIETLPQELLSSIVEDLCPNDKFSLLRVCKPLYYAVRPHLWHTLQSPDIPRTMKSKRKFLEITKTPGLSQLAKIANDIGVDAMGFAHVKKLVFKPGEIMRNYGGADAGLDGLAKILCDQLQAGKMKLQQVELCWADIYYAPDSVIKLLEILKDYEKLNLPQRPSIETRLGYDYSKTSQGVTFPIKCFALECITNLEIGFCGEYYHLTTDVSVSEIELLTNTLKGTRFLQYLAIRGKDGLSDILYQINQLPQLEQLQDAITSLKYLRGLGVSKCVFHPSFFITPPENTKKVTIRQEVSIAWWRKFAQCPFVGLEDLTLDTLHAGTRLGFHDRSQWLSDEDEEVTEAGNENFYFLLGEVAIRGLKKLRIHSNWFYSPEDLIPLIRRNSPDLKEFQRFDDRNI